MSLRYNKNSKSFLIDLNISTQKFIIEKFDFKLKEVCLSISNECTFWIR
jgi:hypothetical protein